MKIYFEQRLKGFENKTGAWGCIFSGLLIILVLIFSTLLDQGFENDDFPFIIFLTVLTIVIFLIYYNFKRSGVQFNKTDKNILKILTEFLKFSEIPKNERYNIIREQFYVHSEKKLKELFRIYNNKDTLYYGACRNLASESSEARLYTLYSLLDIAAKDKLLSIDEDSFIEEIRQRINIHKKTYNYIKYNFIKLGLQEERKIIEEQKRKKINESFLPYNAYKVLGISPDVTKEQLKKVYRKLVKIYHPDKYFGQSEEVIQKKEDKFQDITRAYEIIIKHKQF